MTKFDINYTGGSKQTLLSRREIHIGPHISPIETPTSATFSRRATNDDHPHEAAQQVYEVYRQAKPEKLQSKQLRKALRKGKKNAPSDAVVFPFINWVAPSAIGLREAEELVGLMAKHGDVITVPLQSEIRSSLGDEGTGSVAFDNYWSGIESILRIATESYPDIPVVGTLPCHNHDVLRTLIRSYQGDYGINGFCINFNGGTATAKAKTEYLKALHEMLGREGWERDRFLYAINIKSNQRTTNTGLQVADDMLAPVLGIDIIGNNHVAHIPPEGIEPKETFTIADSNQLVYREVAPEDIPAHFPEESALDPEAVRSQVKEGGTKQRRKYESLLRSEQAGIAARALRQVGADTTIEALKEKSGATERILNTGTTVWQAYQDGKSQTQLEDF